MPVLIIILFDFSIPLIHNTYQQHHRDFSSMMRFWSVNGFHFKLIFRYFRCCSAPVEWDGRPIKETYAHLFFKIRLAFYAYQTDSVLYSPLYLYSNLLGFECCCSNYIRSFSNNCQMMSAALVSMPAVSGCLCHLQQRTNFDMFDTMIGTRAWFVCHAGPWWHPVGQFSHKCFQRQEGWIVRYYSMLRHCSSRRWAKPLIRWMWIGCSCELP